VAVLDVLPGVAVLYADVVKGNALFGMFFHSFDSANRYDTMRISSMSKTSVPCGRPGVPS
jgi:hypothetical protein